MKCIINRKNKGFTLIEVIVAVSIVIILSTLAVPKVSGYMAKAKEAKTMSMGKEIYTAAMWSYADQGDKFTVDNVKAAVETTSNIKLITETPIALNGTHGVKISYISDSKTYEIDIDGDASNYTITDKTAGSSWVYDSTK